MINTVLGETECIRMGVTLTHEHIVWSNDELNQNTSRDEMYDRSDVLRVMLPNLLAVREAGCQTFVDATPPGCGRDVTILRECSEKSGLNIITNTGAFLDFGGRYISKPIREGSEDCIADAWEREFIYGIDGTGVRPGFIKIALATDEVLSRLEEKVLRAASRTSLRTGMAIQCHVVYASKARQAVDVITKEGLSLDKFIWVHCDAEGVIDTISELGGKGVWLEIDSWARMKKYDEAVDMIRKLLDKGLLDKILLSQDSGTYGFVDSPIVPCAPILTEFVPYCLEHGISRDMLDRIMISNPSKALDI